MTSLWSDQGIYRPARQQTSPHQDGRPDPHDISLVVIHAISLPPGEYGGSGIEQLFTGQLDPTEHPYYASIAHLEVSAHFVIHRTGELIQFVPCEQRAWHAGKSVWEGRDRCNDFSIGIELEGTDGSPFAEAQYQTLLPLLTELCAHYPITAITGHEHIAPGRKTDPGSGFEWGRLKGFGMLDLATLQK